MADLFAETDCFVFPYRQIDASGVYFLTKSLNKWTHRQPRRDVRRGRRGRSARAADPARGSAGPGGAMAAAIRDDPARPTTSPPSSAWLEIGHATRDVYQQGEAACGLSRPRSAGCVDRHRWSRRWSRIRAGWRRCPRRQPRRRRPSASRPATAIDWSRTGISPRGSATTRSPASGVRHPLHLRRADRWTTSTTNGAATATATTTSSRARGLSLVARAPSGPLGPGAIESGMLRSRWSGGYGVFEIRMRVPAGRGLWPAFWLNPEDQRWPPEIDVVEIVNNGRDDTRQSFHFLHPDASPRATVAGARGSTASRRSRPASTTPAAFTCSRSSGRPSACATASTAS